MATALRLPATTSSTTSRYFGFLCSARSMTCLTFGAQSVAIRFLQRVGRTGEAISGADAQTPCSHISLRPCGLLRTIQHVDEPLPHLGGATRRRDVLELQRLLQGELEPPAEQIDAATTLTRANRRGRADATRRCPTCAAPAPAGVPAAEPRSARALPPAVERGLALERPNWKCRHCWL